MSRLVPAYDAQTGKKLRYLVHEHAFDNPLYKGRILRTPRSAAQARKSAPRTPAATPAPVETSTTPDTPASGDEKEQ